MGAVFVFVQPELAKNLKLANTSNRTDVLGRFESPGPGGPSG